MRSRLSILLLLIIVVALLTPGCTGTGKQDDVRTPVTNGTAAPTAITNASQGQYADEFRQGFGHHTLASGLFNNATALWNNDSYTAASELLGQAQREYATATEHYQHMATYAGDDSEAAFAESLEGSSIAMDEATSRYLMSIDASMAGNDTAALDYFTEGSALVDEGMMSLNSSLQVMPPGLG